MESVIEQYLERDGGDHGGACHSMRVRYAYPASEVASIDTAEGEPGFSDKRLRVKTERSC